MDSCQRLDDALQAARERGIEVRTEFGEDHRSGFCLFRGRPIVVIDPTDDEAEQLRHLQEALAATSRRAA
jgi:hypothetical protein